LADRLNAAGGDPVGGAPQRLPAIRAGVLGVQQDERHPRRRRKPFHLPHVLVVSLLIQHEQRRVLRQRPGGDHPPRGGGLAGAGRAEQHDMLPVTQRQPRSTFATGGHRHERDRCRPRPVVHQFSLTTEIHPLPRGADWGGLPDPSA